MEQIFALRHLLDLCKRYYARETVFLFVDFSKAFDSVSFISIRRSLEAWRISADFIDAILAPYRNHTVTITDCSVQFKLEQGVLQGDTVAPYLFLLVLDAVLFKALTPKLGLIISSTGTKSRGHTEYLTDLDYADDLLIVSDTVEKVQTQLHSLQEAAGDVGLSINVGKGKTEYLVEGCRLPGNGRRRNEKPAKMFSKDGKEIELVDQYTYLGSNPFDIMADFKKRKGKAWAALKRFDPLFKAKGVSDEAKIAVVMSIVRTVFTYGGAIWPTTHLWQTFIDTAFSQMLRYARQLPRRTPLSELYMQGRVQRLSTVLMQMRLNTVGHALRHDTAFRRVIRIGHALYADPKGNPLERRSVLPRRVGCPPWTFWPSVISELNVHEEEIVKLAQDRTTYRTKVRNIATARERRLHEFEARQHLHRAVDEQRVASAAWQYMLERDVLANPFHLNHSQMQPSTATTNLQFFLKPQPPFYLDKQRKNKSRYPTQRYKSSPTCTTRFPCPAFYATTAPQQRLVRHEEERQEWRRVRASAEARRDYIGEEFYHGRLDEASLTAADRALLLEWRARNDL